MKKTQIAAQLYTVRDFCKTAEELEASLNKIKQLGYSAVQVSGIGPIAPELVKEITERIGLTICATHISYDRLVNDLEAVIQEHLSWNCKYVGIGSLPDSYRTSKAGYIAFAEEFNIISDKLASAGLQFIYHNHHFEFTKFEGITGMDLLFQTASPSFGFELDLYWVQAGGANPVDWINKVSGRMQVVHLKDMAIVENNPVFAEIGEGNLNWPAILQACRDSEVEWYVVEQDTCLRDPFESLAISFNYLQNLV
ncbi:sugar phosphate isomerase/epimerase [Paenibacillus psychroresistens]|uniref:Sugar phosphate isomerase/epimerase n=1 Tax=Paenibacillus psychroresistens TaxID=1778678 RepID=A0A6B8RRS2_9BACL|nr:sugar phosphate isomerase/epimerase [Paenibacillus psychroresistens]QGQ98086.1 sugar phosphate isomerase/epimerase [Paenibacillus psychroresistens]